MSLFPKFNYDELVKFIQCMDLLIDTWNLVPPAVLKAASAARAETGLQVPIESPRVGDVPYHYEDRLELLSMELKKLRIFVPEQHDLALMKIVRGERHDEDVIAEIHTRYPFKLEILLDRFEEEMGHVIKDERILRSQRKPGAGGMRV